MKKLIIPILILIIALLCTEIIVLYNRQAEEELYMLPQSYGYKYKADRKMILNVYSNKKNTIIKYKDENQYIIKGENYYYTLENVDIDIYKQSNIYQIKISSDLPEIECDLKSFELLIINESFSVSFDAGALFIDKLDNYELLSINKIYPSYSYINKNLHLVGMNIELFNNYETLFKLEINNSAIGALDKSLANVELENEIDIKKVIPDYEIGNVNPKALDLNSRKYFIPIGYSKLLFIKEGVIRLKLDDKNYYIDNIPFMVNDIEYSEYMELMNLGEIEYARA